MNQASLAQNNAFPHMAMAAAGVQVPSVNGSLLAAANQPVSTKLPIGNNSSVPLGSVTPGSNKLPTSTPSTSAGAQSKLPTTTPSIGIQFPKDASLGSQLASVAVLGQKPFTRPSGGATSLSPSQWCNKHVTIAQTISAKAKGDAKGPSTSTANARNPTVNDPAKVSSPVHCCIRAFICRNLFRMRCLHRPRYLKSLYNNKLFPLPLC